MVTTIGDAVLRDRQSGAAVVLTTTATGEVELALRTAGRKIDTTTLTLELSEGLELQAVQPRAGIQVELEQQSDERSVVHLHATTTGEVLSDTTLATLTFTNNPQASVAVGGALFLNDATLIHLTPALLSFSN